MFEHPSWAVAAAIMVMDMDSGWQPNRRWHYRDLTDRVLATELSDLTKLGGVTPQNTLAKFMYSDEYRHIFVGGDGSGYYKLRSIEAARDEPKVRAALAAIRRLEQKNKRPEQSGQPVARNASPAKRRVPAEPQGNGGQLAPGTGWKLVLDVLVALAKVESDISITRLNNVIRNKSKYPDFVAKQYGYGTFTLMLKDMQRQGLLQLSDDGNLRTLNPTTSPHLSPPEAKGGCMTAITAGSSARSWFRTVLPRLSPPEAEGVQTHKCRDCGKITDDFYPAGVTSEYNREAKSWRCKRCHELFVGNGRSRNGLPWRQG